MRPLLAVVQLATMMPMLVLFTNFQSGFDELGQHYTEVCFCACLPLSLSLSLILSHYRFTLYLFS